MSGDRKEDERKPEERRAVSLVVEYEGAADMYRDYTQNLSTGGVFIHTERDLAVGDRVSLKLSFPRLLAPLSIEGEVRWVRSVADSDNGVGIEFVNFDDKVRAELELILQHIRDRDPDYVEPTLRVLLVEDNPHVARLVGDGMGRYADADVECINASNGQEALDLIFSESFDVLVIDVNLPVVDGAEVISQVRASEDHKHLPVIAVSAGGAQARMEAMAAGADFFLEKPMRLREILETMQRLLDVGDVP